MDKGAAGLSRVLPQTNPKIGFISGSENFGLLDLGIFARKDTAT